MRVALLDGLRNLLPSGVDRAAQSEMSTLVDAYKSAEAVEGPCAGIYSLSSILTDRAEPNEALRATIVWSTGLEDADVLLSEDQVRTFRLGGDVRSESRSRGRRGAFFVHATLELAPDTPREWHTVADVERCPAQVADLLRVIRTGVEAETVERDVADGTARLERLAGSADAFQACADALESGRHFSNTLCNIMRGGVFRSAYEFPRDDFLAFVATRNRALLGVVRESLGAVKGPLTLDATLDVANRSGSDDFVRCVYEYLPLTFSRRHGDPSRPWNHFSIDIQTPDGAECLRYQGNWRDIFQNWEALALSFPGYIESFVAKFVNASTADGFNPYRVSTEGIDWETPEPSNAWSNIGYWGDHQVVYLLRLLELSRAYHPQRLEACLERPIFVYADVPYRIRPYAEMLRDPRNTVDYDDDRARAVAERVAAIGADGRLVATDGSVLRVNLVEKLLVTAFVRIGNLIPGGGIWMNTQRPEWNDANNALVGYGLSMVTLCYLSRYLRLLKRLIDDSEASGFDLSDELLVFLRDVARVLDQHSALLQGPVDPAARKAFMDALGTANDRYRASVYGGLAGDKTRMGKAEIVEAVALALRYVEHSIAWGRRPDGLFHSYNLLRFADDGHHVEPLDEMLEGQVAALSSGHLDAEAVVGLLDALRDSKLYRADQNSYVLYPDRTLPSYLEKNVIPQGLVDGNPWIQAQLDAGRTDYVERDLDGRVHFNSDFRNGQRLQAALDADASVGQDDARSLCETYEAVFQHRRFTGRSGSMYKYEGLGCIYWHMVSKLLLATAEVTRRAVDDDVDRETVDRLVAHFGEIRRGIGLHKSPADYGAFPVDPYSHTPGFVGVQQPGLTGQVKEDVISRFWQLGVRVADGDVSFDPLVLHADEFLRRPCSWRYSTGGDACTETLPEGSLGFTLCGVVVIYRLADDARIQVVGEDRTPQLVPGNRLGPQLSRSVFAREGHVRKLIVDIPRGRLA